MGKVSGPILDRMDLVTRVEDVSLDALIQNRQPTESSEKIRERVCRARSIQEERFAGTDILCNAGMGIKEVREYCSLSAEAEEKLFRAFGRMRLSARGYHKILRVARTIADLEAEEKIRLEHIEEALLYRNRD